IRASPSRRRRATSPRAIATASNTGPRPPRAASRPRRRRSRTARRRRSPMSWACSPPATASTACAPTPRRPRHGAVAAPLVQVLCLAQLGVLALEEDDVETAEVCISRARRQVERTGLGDCPLAALVFAASALGRAQRGRVDEAQRDMREGTRLLATLADFTPWYEVEARLLLARAALRLSDVVGARTLLAEASRLVRRAPDRARRPLTRPPSPPSDDAGRTGRLGESVGPRVGDIRRAACRSSRDRA